MQFFVLSPQKGARVESMADMDIVNFDDALHAVFGAEQRQIEQSDSAWFDELSTALADESNNKCDVNVATIMHTLNTVPVMVDATDGTKLPLFAAFDAIVKRSNAQFEKIHKIHTCLISTAMQQQLKIKELENEIKNLAVDYRYTQKSCHEQGIVCAHCLAAPALFQSGDKFFCSTVCQEQTLLNDWSEC